MKELTDERLHQEIQRLEYEKPRLVEWTQYDEDRLLAYRELEELRRKVIAKLPGCQEATISEEWWMAINPHPEPEKCRKGTRIPPFTIYFEFNGWPAGFVNAGGGTMAAGRIANEHRLLAAIEAAIEKTGAERWD